MSDHPFPATSEHFEEIDHTADWAIRVRGQDLPELFVNAARGMYSLLVDLERVSLSEQRSVEVEGVSLEGLLVAWLSQLLYLTETERLIFGRFVIDQLQPSTSPESGSLGRLRATAEGGRAQELRKYIKAVTYHGLSIRQEDGRYVAEIVFDV